jgi:protein-tyrosine-phosphatase
MFSRRVMLAITVAALGAGLSRAAPALAAEPQTRVLFVCQFGSVKSAISRELLRRLATQSRAPLAIESRGITPEAHLPPPLAQRLAEAGVDPKAEPLRKLTQADLDRADLVVIFDPLPAGLSAKNLRDWTDLGSIVSDYDRTRPDLDRRIEGLFKTLHPPARQP